MLGIVAALEMERRWLAVTTGGCPPLVERSGPGALPASAAAERLIARGATALASWGVAAGLDDRLAAGTVVLPRRIVVADHETYDVDVGWHAVLCTRLDGAIEMATEDLAHAAKLLETPAAKARLHARLGACAADMESAAVAGVAAAAAVPFLAVRVVLDGARTALPPLLRSAVDASGRLRTVWLAWAVITRPGAWAAMTRMARAHVAARRAMRRLWNVAAPDLCLGGRVVVGEPCRDGARPGWGSVGS